MKNIAERLLRIYHKNCIRGHNLAHKISVGIIDSFDIKNGPYSPYIKTLSFKDNSRLHIAYDGYNLSWHIE
jgi:hypothetical protein